MAFVAKDAKGFQKSLGGDVFTVSWARAGDDEPPTFGMGLKALYPHPRNRAMAHEAVQTFQHARSCIAWTDI